MSMLWQIRREFSAFFYSPIAYVVIGAGTLLNSVMFFLIILFLSRSGPAPGAPMEMLFSWVLFWLVVMILTPLITMRSFAEEKHSGTLETLVTAPISDIQIVLAKYFSCLAFYVILWLPTLLYPLILSKFSAIDMGPVLSGYLGTFGIGVMLISVGVLCSALTRNQIVASLVTFATMMALFLSGLFRWVDGLSLQSLFEYIDLMAHMEDFAKGIIDTRRLVYYGSVALFSLFATVQVLAARRWRA
ncbi:MAG: ABC transporter permease [Deltaproteobacteria bacterium]|nr:ABC transporter permease [Deltaproteobacteria bacterium]MBN2670048.1 ABC transporter permease [Deltaproteobacteria bacterium]